MKNAKQIPVSKSERRSDGSWTEPRRMTIGEDVWKRIQSNKMPAQNVKWELLANNEPVARELMPEAKKPVSTKKKPEPIAVVEEDETEENEEIDYSNYTIKELREKCKNLEISFSNAEKETALIAKIKKHEGSSN